MFISLRIALSCAALLLTAPLSSASAESLPQAGFDTAALTQSTGLDIASILSESNMSISDVVMTNPRNPWVIQVGQLHSTPGSRELNQQWLNNAILSSQRSVDLFIGSITKRNRNPLFYIEGYSEDDIGLLFDTKELCTKRMSVRSFTEIYGSSELVGYLTSYAPERSNVVAGQNFMLHFGSAWKNYCDGTIRLKPSEKQTAVMAASTALEAITAIRMDAMRASRALGERFTGARYKDFQESRRQDYAINIDSPYTADLEIILSETTIPAAATVLTDAITKIEVLQKAIFEERELATLATITSNRNRDVSFLVYGKSHNMRAVIQSHRVEVNYIFLTSNS